jgi:hypothetical protein
MLTFTVFQKPVSRPQHKKRTLRMCSLMVSSSLRHSPVHRRQQINLVRNRYLLGWGTKKVRALIAKYGG